MDANSQDADTVLSDDAVRAALEAAGKASDGPLTIHMRDVEAFRRYQLAGADGLLVANGLTAADAAYVASIWGLAPALCRSWLALRAENLRLAMQTPEDRDIEAHNAGADLTAEALLRIAQSGRDAGVFGGEKVEAAAQAILVLRAELLALAGRLRSVQEACDTFEKNSADATHLWELLREVYRQAGNEAPAERRHALTPGLRDQIRDVVFARKEPDHA